MSRFLAPATAPTPWPARLVLFAGTLLGAYAIGACYLALTHAMDRDVQRARERRARECARLLGIAPTARDSLTVVLKADYCNGRLP